MNFGGGPFATGFGAAAVVRVARAPRRSSSAAPSQSKVADFGSRRIAASDSSAGSSRGRRSSVSFSNERRGVFMRALLGVPHVGHRSITGGWQTEANVSAGGGRGAGLVDVLMNKVYCRFRVCQKGRVAVSEPSSLLLPGKASQNLVIASSKRCGDATEHLVVCSCRAFENHVPARFDHMDGPGGEVQPPDIESIAEGASFRGYEFMQLPALGLSQPKLVLTFEAVAARDEGEDAQPSHPALQAEGDHPLHDPCAPRYDGGLDRCGNAGCNETAEIAGGVVEGINADDAVVVFTVAVETDLDLGACCPEERQQRIGDRDGVGGELRFGPPCMGMGEQLREGRVDGWFAAAEVQGLHPVGQEPVNALHEGLGRLVVAGRWSETEAAPGVAGTGDPKADCRRQVEGHGGASRCFSGGTQRACCRKAYPARWRRPAPHGCGGGDRTSAWAWSAW